MWDKTEVHFGLSESYYGMFKGRDKGREKEGTRWIREEQVEKEREEGIKGSVYKLVLDPDVLWTVHWHLVSAICLTYQILVSPSFCVAPLPILSPCQPI